MPAAPLLLDHLWAASGPELSEAHTTGVQSPNSPGLRFQPLTPTLAECKLGFGRPRPRNRPHTSGRCTPVSPRGPTILPQNHHSPGGKGNEGPGNRLEVTLQATQQGRVENVSLTPTHPVPQPCSSPLGSNI